MNQPSTGSVHEFRWPVGVTQSIAWPSNDVWEAISTPGILELCHPFCQANPVTVWPGAGSLDEVHYFNGMVYERRFLEWIDGVGYSLEIGEHGQPDPLDATKRRNTCHKYQSGTYACASRSHQYERAMPRNLRLPRMTGNT
ncbi:MAG: hypothetical protein QGM46_11440 [Actinomycetota bacterium]|nr:hypothetical protein [Actinomycetota bacterium]